MGQSMAVLTLQGKEPIGRASALDSKSCALPWLYVLSYLLFSVCLGFGLARVRYPGQVGY